MLRNLLSNTVYIRIKRNQFRIRHIDSGIETTVQSETPFTTVRMLVGEYTAAEKTLKAALKQVAKSWLQLPPHVVIHPLEMIEGGLSQIEDRILHELAIGAGASKVVVWIGSELSDSEVKEKLNGK